MRAASEVISAVGAVFSSRARRFVARPIWGLALPAQGESEPRSFTPSLVQPFYSVEGFQRFSPQLSSASKRQRFSEHDRNVLRRHVRLNVVYRIEHESAARRQEINIAPHVILNL